MNKNFQRSHLCIPYGLFLVCFVLAPLVVIIYYAFTNGEGKPTLENLTGFFSSPNTIGLRPAPACCWHIRSRIFWRAAR